MWRLKCIRGSSPKLSLRANDDASAKLLFKGDKVGGTVKDLIYKGNGREYENIPSEKALSRLFR